MEKKNRNSGKRTVKDLTPREKHDVRGGTFTAVFADVKAAWAAAAPTVAGAGADGGKLNLFPEIPTIIPHI